MTPERETQMREAFEAHWVESVQKRSSIFTRAHMTRWHDTGKYMAPGAEEGWQQWLACARALEPKWQPIETAPKDGTEILLSRVAYEVDGEPVTPCVTSGAWIEWKKTTSEYHGTTGEYLGQSVQDEGAGWASWNGGFADDAPPTHWMPLPEQPNAAMSAALEDGNATE